MWLGMQGRAVQDGKAKTNTNKLGKAEDKPKTKRGELMQAAVGPLPSLKIFFFWGGKLSPLQSKFFT